MPVHTDKARAKTTRAHTDAAHTDAAPVLADNRPASIAQRKLQQALDDSPQVAQLHAVRQLIGNAPAIRQLEALQAAQSAALGDKPDIATDKPVQRVVRWNGMTYRAAQAGVLRRALRRTDLSAGEIDTIVAQAGEDGAPYVYDGVGHPVLRARAVPANAVPALLPPPPIPVQNDAPPIPVQNDAPPIPVQNDAPVPGPDDAPAIAVQNGVAVLAQNNVPVPLAAPAHPVGRHQSNVALGRLAYNHNLPGLTPYLRGTIANYRDAYNTRTGTVNALDDPGFAVGRQLYHATPIATARLIRDSALSPKMPAWGGASASKDNYLSFARSEANANALGGVAIVLRVILDATEIGPGKWRRASATEVLTTQTFLPGRLDWTRKGQPLNWQPLNTLPDPP
ncbi:MAG: hypothetical protein JWM65_886 [Sphingomonas bacterium]|nr:hypothetical protein [Sphingomonas bacterium]